MASVNKFIGIGNLGRDPETRYMPNGDAVTNISIASTETWKDKQTGEKKEQTEWVRVTFYRKLAALAVDAGAQAERGVTRSREADSLRANGSGKSTR